MTAELELGDMPEKPKRQRVARPRPPSDHSPPMEVQSAGGEAGVASPPQNMLALIDRALHSDRPIDVSNLNALLDFQLKVEAAQAEKDFNAAKGRILKKLADIRFVKNKSVQFEVEKGNPKKGFYEAYRYVPLEEIDRQMKPLLAEEDMDLSWSNETREGGGLLVRGRLKHLPGGHFEDSFMPSPMDTSGGKSSVQGTGSTNSFLRRYITCNIFNIVVVGDDDDGIGGYCDSEQIRKIRSILGLIHKADSRRGNEDGFVKVMRVKSLDEMPQRKYREAMSKLSDVAIPLGIEVDADLSS